MPRNDGTGPYGDGRPGRGLGTCGRFGRPYGYGYRYGRGNGFQGGFNRHDRRLGNDYAVPVYPEDSGYIQPYTKESLQARKRELENELKWLGDELKESDHEDK